MTLGAVLFDLDGLLVDSEPLWTVAEEELAARHGATWTAELKAAVVGTRLDASVPLILTGLGVAPTPELIAATQHGLLARMTELFHLDLPLRPGARALLGACRDRGIPTALVSSSYRVLVDAALKTLGPENFNLTIAGDEVTHGKPDPEPYRTAAAALGVPPSQAVVLEDSLAGAESARSAGCPCIAVPSVAPIPDAPGRTIRSSLTQVDIPLLECLTVP